jgi:hypothetical protein
MKHLKTYNLFEAVIMPNRTENNFRINSFEDSVEYGIQNDFDVVQYDEFYNSLDDNDRKTAPPRRGVPFFALYHTERTKPMFVVCDTMVFRFMPMKEIIDDIIGHEKIHVEQSRRKGDIKYSLPNPNDRKAYFSNKEEIMAFSFTIANSLSKTMVDVETAMVELDRPQELQRQMGPPPGGMGRPPMGPPPGGMGRPPMGPPPGPPPAEYKMLWPIIKRVCDEDVIKRYRKYIYMYLEKMLVRYSNNINTKINNR